MNKNVTKLNLNLTLITMFSDAAGILDREGYRYKHTLSDGTVCFSFPTSEELELLMERTATKVFRNLVAKNVNVTRKNAKDIILAYINVEQVKEIIVKKFELVKEN